MKNSITIILVLVHVLVLGQSDTVMVLSYNDFITIVKNEHPVAKQANLKINEGDAQLLYAKGAFDPKIYTKINQKYYKGDQYYSQIDGGLKIPTWFGIELKGGYEQNQGNYLNPQNTTPNNGLLYAGISVPIGQGLFIDKRRAELKKAKLFQKVSAMEQQIILNELEFSAGTAYWKWFKAYNSFLVYTNAYKFANERFEAVKASAEMGDKPTIDTLEARIQMQNRLLGLQQSTLDYTNASALLSIFLWDEGVVPLELAEGTIPVVISENLISETTQGSHEQIDSLINYHPKLNQYGYIINQLEIDKQYKKNQLLPILNLKYNPITEYVGGESLNNYSINNYTWGLEFVMPVFLRKERGSLKITDLKIQEYNLELANNREILKYKVVSAHNKWAATEEQVKMYVNTVSDANSLLEGERQLFNNGESSLFMVNSREMGYIKAQLMLIKLLVNNRNAELSTNYALGGLDFVP